jgi:pyrimidine operon attenuation protein / uracil phosphoribosyltransferase
MKTQDVLGEDEIRENTEKLVESILSGCDNPKNLVLIGIITRGATLAERMKAMISKKAGADVKVGSLDTTPYRDDEVGKGDVDRSQIPFDMTGKDVILIDDVISGGRTMRAALDGVMAKGRPRSVKTAVLVDRGHRVVPITADYIGVKIATSKKEKVRVRLKEVDGGRDRAYIETK